MKMTTTILFAAGVAVSVYAAYRFGKSRRNSDKFDKPSVNVTKPTSNQSEKNEPKVSAKQCFIQNISSFSPLLDGLHQGKIDSQKWMETIVTMNNDDLLDYWKKVKDNANKWVMILQMWGVSYDNCTEFSCIDYYKNLYMLQNGDQLQNGKKYKVISPCWVYTELSENGSSSKKLITKGIVSEK